MTGKLFLVFALAGFAVAGVKTYPVSLNHPSMVGNTLLRSGEYRLEVDGSQAVFMDLSRHKAAEANVKLDSASKKFQSTEIETRDVDGKTKLEQIRLGGTATILEFTN